MQYSVHDPSPFICTNLDKLLPTWSVPVRSVLIVLQPCTCNLLERTPLAEQQKFELRQKFLQFGYDVAAKLQQLGHLVDVFDPRTGLPLLSQAGPSKLDDVAVVRSCLGYPSSSSHGCSVVVHPTWGSSVYPSTLVSSAPPQTVQWVSQATNPLGTTISDCLTPQDGFLQESVSLSATTVSQRAVD